MDSENTVSRRGMLKKIGLGAAVVWAAPVLTSLQTPASASTLGKGKRCTQQNITDPNSQAACNWCVPPACPGTQCGFCFPTVKGCCFCTNNFFCSQASPCSTKADCPTGSDCGYTCCSQSQALCLPPAGSISCPTSGTRDSGRKTAAGV